MTVPSPCVSICALDPDTGFCQGCGRTLDEIAAWARLSDVDKRRVLARIRERRAGQGD